MSSVLRAICVCIHKIIHVVALDLLVLIYGLVMSELLYQKAVGQLNSLVVLNEDDLTGCIGRSLSMAGTAR